MIIGCPECGETKNITEPLPEFKQYRCDICGTNLIYSAAQVETPDDARLLFFKGVKQTALFLIAIVLLFTLAGTALAFVEPENAFARPFKTIAARVTEASVEHLDLIEGVRGLAATYERNIVSEAVQAMRTLEDLIEVPAVMVSTNDMLYFPSEKYSLFPHYLDKRYSQFKYTVDSNGIISVDTSGATTDAMLKKINGQLSKLESPE